MVGSHLLVVLLLQEKMETKAYKLKASEIKTICDFFTIDRSGHSSKESQVELLLDFLGEPREDLLKGSKASGEKKAAAKKEKAKKEKKAKAAEEDDDDDEAEEAGNDNNNNDDDKDDEELLHPKKGEMPSDKTLHAWVRAFVRCYDTESAKIATALDIAHKKFGVDMADKKEQIKTWLMEEV